MRRVPTLSTTRDLPQPYAVPSRPLPHILPPAVLVPAPDRSSPLFGDPRRDNHNSDFRDCKYCEKLCTRHAVSEFVLKRIKTPRPVGQLKALTRTWIHNP